MVRFSDPPSGAGIKGEDRITVLALCFVRFRLRTWGGRRWSRTCRGNSLARFGLMIGKWSRISYMFPRAVADGWLPGRPRSREDGLQPLQAVVCARLWLKLLDKLLDAGVEARSTAPNSRRNARRSAEVIIGSLLLPEGVPNGGPPYVNGRLLNEIPDVLRVVKPNQRTCDRSST